MTVQLPLAALVLFWIFAACIPLSIVVGILLTAIRGDTTGKPDRTSGANRQLTGKADRVRQSGALSVSDPHLSPTGPTITVRQRATKTTAAFATEQHQFWHPPMSDTLH